MKSLIFFKVIPFVVVVIAGSFYGLYLHTGQVPWQHSDVLRFKALSSQVDSVFDDLSPEKLANSVEASVNLAAESVIFRWYTADGGLVYGDEPPPDAVRVELLREADLSPLTVLDHNEVVAEGDAAQPTVAERPKELTGHAKGGAALLQEAKALKAKIEKRYRDYGMLPDE